MADHAQLAAELAERGAELAERGAYDDAAALFGRALQLRPDDAALHEMLAQCLLEAGGDEAACVSAAAAVRLRPGWPGALLTLGRAARNAGRLREARAAFEHCLECAGAPAAARPGRLAALALQPAGGEEEVAEAAKEELAEVEELLEGLLGRELGLPGLRLPERRGAAAGPSGVVWEAGALLAYFLVQQQKQQQQQHGNACSQPAVAQAASQPSHGCGFWRGARVLELGAGGTGVVGLAAACLGASVTATDLPEVLPQLAASAALNRGLVRAAGGELHAAALDWQRPDLSLLCPQPPAPRHDWLLGADLVYTPGAVGPLVATVVAAARHAAASGAAPLKVLISHKHRHDDVDAALLAGLGAAGVGLRAVLRDAGTQCTVWANDAARAALSL